MYRKIKLSKDNFRNEGNLKKEEDFGGGSGAA